MVREEGGGGVTVEWGGTHSCHYTDGWRLSGPLWGYLSYISIPWTIAEMVLEGRERGRYTLALEKSGRHVWNLSEVSSFLPVYGCGLKIAEY